METLGDRLRIEWQGLRGLSETKVLLLDLSRQKLIKPLPQNCSTTRGKSLWVIFTKTKTKTSKWVSCLISHMWFNFLIFYIIYELYNPDDLIYSLRHICKWKFNSFNYIWTLLIMLSNTNICISKACYFKFLFLVPSLSNQSLQSVFK